ncbi:DinB family protein [Planococcus sp. N028]|uniref:DinB family protein n=1 Tax=Planococcus shixiaomingii TaxID=3058393 RepID=A0ABT8N6B2_9BACL|nr:MULTISPECIES: DinB family protein [unclassified Planococcus (in: firmicutes)]MDN7243420.1 DinB family protein [Planococcus sp. N028]WKA55867.1 DinB family protein [Planococcus sp. N022]
MSKKEMILDQLSVCRNMDSWIKPLSTALEGLRLEEVTWKPNEASNSISEITSHLLFYNDRWMKRFKGEPVGESPELNSDTFQTIDGLTEDSWQRHVAKLDAGLEQWQKVIEDSTEEELHGSIPGFPEEAVWWEALSNLCTHNTYHTGQIIYIRKALGNWEIAPDWE